MDDLLVGAPMYGKDGVDQGRVFVYSAKGIVSIDEDFTIRQGLRGIGKGLCVLR